MSEVINIDWKSINQKLSQTGTAMVSKENMATVSSVLMKLFETEYDKAYSKSSALGRYAITALNSLPPVLVSQKTEAGFLYMDIDFSSSESGKMRKSFRKGPLNNVIALLNNGYADNGWGNKKLFGMWHGRKIAALNARTGAGFVQEAVQNFKQEATALGYIVQVDISDEYSNVYGSAANPIALP